jgi:hypothetical protein
MMDAPGMAGMFSSAARASIRLPIVSMPTRSRLGLAPSVHVFVVAHRKVV